jgi:hypothetical protein
VDENICPAEAAAALLEHLLPILNRESPQLRRLTLILLRLLLVASSRLPTAAVIFIHRLLLPSFFLLPLSTIHLPYPAIEAAYLLSLTSLFPGACGCIPG